MHSTDDESELLIDDLPQFLVWRWMTPLLLLTAILSALFHIPLLSVAMIGLSALTNLIIYQPLFPEEIDSFSSFLRSLIRRQNNCCRYSWLVSWIIMLLLMPSIWSMYVDVDHTIALSYADLSQPSLSQVPRCDLATSANTVYLIHPLVTQQRETWLPLCISERDEVFAARSIWSTLHIFRRGKVLTNIILFSTEKVSHGSGVMCYVAKRYGWQYRLTRLLYNRFGLRWSALPLLFSRPLDLRGLARSSVLLLLIILYGFYLVWIFNAISGARVYWAETSPSRLADTLIVAFGRRFDQQIPFQVARYRNLMQFNKSRAKQRYWLDTLRCLGSYIPHYLLFKWPRLLLRKVRDKILG